jgi:hypothetical protein
MHYTYLILLCWHNILHIYMYIICSGVKDKRNRDTDWQLTCESYFLGRSWVLEQRGYSQSAQALLSSFSRTSKISQAITPKPSQHNIRCNFHCKHYLDHSTVYSVNYTELENYGFEKRGYQILLLAVYCLTVLVQFIALICHRVITMVHYLNWPPSKKW